MSSFLLLLSQFVFPSLANLWQATPFPSWIDFVFRVVHSDLLWYVVLFYLFYSFVSTANQLFPRIKAVSKVVRYLTFCTVLIFLVRGLVIGLPIFCGTLYAASSSYLDAFDQYVHAQASLLAATAPISPSSSTEPFRAVDKPGNVSVVVLSIVGILVVIVTRSFSNVSS